MRPSPSDMAVALYRMSIGVCFMGGFVTSTVSLLVPRLKLMLGLSYAQALLVQLPFHASYLLFALPVIGSIVRIGYMRAIAAGLAMGLVVAQHAIAFAATLGALLILLAGLTFLQIASDTSITLVGSPGAAASRVTLLQGFNSIGTVIEPVFAAPLLPSESRSALAAPFLASAVVRALLAAIFLVRRDLLPRVVPTTRPGPARQRAVLVQPRLLAGTAAIFGYVGAEVATGTLLTNYVMLPNVLAATPTGAGRTVGLYWAGAMIGRFAGGVMLRRSSAARLLAGAAVGATVLSAAATVLPGVAGAVALLSVGLANSIMYPTIYALALPRDEYGAPLGSMMLCMAVVGGAVVPVATGMLADAAALTAAFALPEVCYLGIGCFAWSCLQQPEPLESQA